ncbi:aminotransferase class I/II-fold pyridoxal phosphate-dependent enzyme [Thalassotalea atypica]|uniref:aminotransferase class I/II-fold pyridoxal phosphate-dependent enzyme n=1 Tax=Thalassotalea atypica TaxID=2054316 RepID=UPI0025725934|nr:aminotransferase class I/II-fold pyridoxal phosphate-dependent enzyme [Thalassotalea atypica]
MTLKELMALSPERAQTLYQEELDYTSLQGSESLRAKIANFHQEQNRHQRKLIPSQVTTFSGAQEALAAIYQSLLQPDDEVIVCTPCYPSLMSMPSIYGARVKPILLSDANQWRFDIEQLKKMVNQKTKLIVINAPHNPTGMVLTPAQQQQVLALAQQVNCYVLSDDVSQAITHGESGQTNINSTLAHDFLDYEKSVVVSVMSKSFGLGGVRIGWAVTPCKLLIKSMISIKARGSICTSRVDETLAEIALEHADQIIRRNQKIVSENKHLLKQFIAQYHDVFSWHPPQAGLLALVKVNLGTPLEPVLKYLAEQTGILLLPVSLFGLNESYVRVGLGQRNLRHGLKALNKLINKQ